MMVKLALKRPVLGALLVALLGTAGPAFAQSSAGGDEARLRKLEAEVRALQRRVFPGSDGKFFTPEVSQSAEPTPAAGLPATTPVTDLLTRMAAVETQISRLTAQNEETANRVAQMEAKLAGMMPASANAAPATATLAAPTAAPAASTPAPAQPALAARPVQAAAKPSPQRVAAVQQVEKPGTDDPADDAYIYGFRLWDAKFYPEAQQQLQLYVDKYPRDAKISYGRNLLGRAFLDDGKPREAAPWFLKNYQTDKRGARAADSLLYLAEAMRQLKDTSRACIALAEFSETYMGEAIGRLKSQYEATKSAVKCN